MEIAMTTIINSFSDAETFVNNSGVSNWEWGGEASAEGFTQFVYRNYEEINEDNYIEELRSYLTTVGENWKDYI